MQTLSGSEEGQSKKKKCANGNTRDRKRGGGDVGMEKEREKEDGEKLASFFGAIYEFFNPVPVSIVPVIVTDPVLLSVNDTNAFVPVVLPARLVPVTFVPASSASIVLQRALLLKLRPMTSRGLQYSGAVIILRVQ